MAMGEFAADHAGEPVVRMDDLVGVQLRIELGGELGDKAG